MRQHALTHKNKDGSSSAGGSGGAGSGGSGGGGSNQASPSHSNASAETMPAFKLKPVVVDDVDADVDMSPPPLPPHNGDEADSPQEQHPRSNISSPSPGATQVKKPLRPVASKSLYF